MPAALQSTTRDSSFASTRWTVVRQAADSQTASQHALSALTELCQIYWRPVFVFLRRQGIPQHDAQDLTQGFFADLIESRAYARADPTKGRFRSFLLGTLKHSWRTRVIMTARKSGVAAMCRYNWMRRRVSEAEMVRLAIQQSEHRRGIRTGMGGITCSTSARSACTGIRAWGQSRAV